MILGSSAPLIVPKNWVLPTPVAGLPRRTPFRRLKASARTSSLCRSRIGNDLESAVSNLQNPGPKTVPTPKSLSVPRAGGANAAGLSQLTQFGVFRHAAPLFDA